MDENLYDKFHDRCEKLTGDVWCPYPSDLFVRVVLQVDDDTAIRLIQERRNYHFGYFLGNDPQHEELSKLIKV